MHGKSYMLYFTHMTLGVGNQLFVKYFPPFMSGNLHENEDVCPLKNGTILKGKNS